MIMETGNDDLDSFENEIYKDNFSISSESDLEEYLYSQVHYASNLDIGSHLDDKSASDNEYPEIQKSDFFVLGEANKHTNKEMVTSVSGHNQWQLDDLDMLDDNDTQKSFKQVSRYYVTSNLLPNMFCYNCDERGHLSRDCLHPKKMMVCYLCGGNHLRQKCKNDLCYNCMNPGHISKNCKEPRSSFKMRCSRCNFQGHLKKNCPEIWRQYHITVKDGIILKPHKNKVNERRYCYNCASKRHFGEECTSKRFSSRSYYSQFVVSYDKCSIVTTQNIKSYENKEFNSLEIKADKFRKLDNTCSSYHTSNPYKSMRSDAENSKEEKSKKLKNTKRPTETLYLTSTPDQVVKKDRRPDEMKKDRRSDEMKKDRRSDEIKKEKVASETILKETDLKENLKKSQVSTSKDVKNKLTSLEITSEKEILTANNTCSKKFNEDKYLVTDRKQCHSSLSEEKKTKKTICLENKNADRKRKHKLEKKNEEISKMNEELPKIKNKSEAEEEKEKTKQSKKKKFEETDKFQILKEKERKIKIKKKEERLKDKKENFKLLKDLSSKFKKRKIESMWLNDESPLPNEVRFSMLKEFGISCGEEKDEEEAITDTPSPLSYDSFVKKVDEKGGIEFIANGDFIPVGLATEEELSYIKDIKKFGKRYNRNHKKNVKKNLTSNAFPQAGKKPPLQSNLDSVTLNKLRNIMPFSDTEEEVHISSRDVILRSNPKINISNEVVAFDCSLNQEEVSEKSFSRDGKICLTRYNPNEVHQEHLMTYGLSKPTQDLRRIVVKKSSQKDSCRNDENFKKRSNQNWVQYGSSKKKNWQSNSYKSKLTFRGFQSVMMKK